MRWLRWLKNLCWAMHKYMVGSPAYREWAADRHFHLYRVDRVRLWIRLWWVSAVGWLTSLDHMHEKLAHLHFSLKLVELRAGRREALDRHLEMTFQHLQSIPGDFIELFDDLHERVAAEEERMGRPRMASLCRLFGRRSEIEPEPPLPYAALAMPVPLPYVRVDARSPVALRRSSSGAST